MKAQPAKERNELSIFISFLFFLVSTEEYAKRRKDPTGEAEILMTTPLRRGVGRSGAVTALAVIHRGDHSRSSQ